MSNPERAILKTLIYFDCYEIPLTSFEIYRYLIKTLKAGKASYSDIVAALCSGGVLRSIIEEKNGFYFLKGKADLAERRIKRDKISAAKWKKLSRYAGILQIVPFLRLIFVSGSLAQNNCRPESDLDLLIVTKSGRIWTSRFLTTALTQILGIRRHGEKVADRICLNHYITDRPFTVPVSNPSLFNAQIYNQLIILFEREAGTFSRFQRENAWIGGHFVFYPFSSSEPEMNLRKVKNIGFLLACARLAEFILSGVLGDWIEKWLARLQGNKIRKNPKTSMPAAGIVVSDNQLRFHPEPQENQILDKYTKAVVKFGAAEQDSI